MRTRILILIRILALPTLMLLSGCERSLFQNPPAAAASCDPALAGRWLSVGDKDDGDGELEAIIDVDCSLFTIEHKADGERRSQPTTLGSARVDGTRYLWLDAAWANRSFEVKANLLDQSSGIYLFAYSIGRDRLRLAHPPHRALAHRVLDKDVAGEVLMREDELTVRVSGDPATIRKVLRKYRLFRFDKALEFRRAAADPTP